MFFHQQRTLKVWFLDEKRRPIHHPASYPLGFVVVHGLRMDTVHGHPLVDLSYCMLTPSNHRDIIVKMLNYIDTAGMKYETVWGDEHEIEPVTLIAVLRM
eukprot:3632262-Rhodomonas_salina.2